MARALRIKYKGALYHITSRGNEKRNIFENDYDREFFIQTLKESLNIYNVILYSYVLMSNHFHFLLETPLANLSEFMRQFNITYTSYYNRRYNRVGHLYQGRYKSILIQKENYLNILSRYIHLNPVRVEKMKNASTSEKKKCLRQFKWSSLKGYLDKENIEPFVDYKTVLAEYGGDNQRGRDMYWQTLQSDLSQKFEIKKKIVGDSILGNDSFIKKIKEKYLKKNEKEIPSLRKINSYCSKDKVIKIVCQEIGQDFNYIKNHLGTNRQILMEMLYRYAGLKGCEIGELMGLDYSTVSVGRKRLRKKLFNDINLQDLVRRIKYNLSIIKI
ncbi:MAG: transposase [Candidatus Atribacteria bacterium]